MVSADRPVPDRIPGSRVEDPFKLEQLKVHLAELCHLPSTRLVIHPETTAAGLTRVGSGSPGRSLSALTASRWSCSSAKSASLAFASAGEGTAS